MQLYGLYGLLCMFCLALADQVLLEKRMVGGEGVEPYEPVRGLVKKPFCNAFTGCGKRSAGKRSEGVNVESMGALVDLSAEPAVEDLRRQILSEAKLWEAIQEARMEINNRKQAEEQQEYGGHPALQFGGHKRSQYYYT